MKFRSRSEDSFEFLRAKIPQFFLGAAAGLGITALFLFLESIVSEVIQPFDTSHWEGIYLRFARLIPGIVVLVGAGAAASWLQRLRWVGFGIGMGAILVYLIAIMASYFDPLGFRGIGSGAQFNLEESIPVPWTSNGEYIPLTKFTPADLNGAQPWWDVRRRAYVPADIASDRSSVISINPIDDFTWGAAAFSNRRALCYLVLLAIDPNDPNHSETFYGILPHRSKCFGSFARRDTVRSQRWVSPE